MTEEKRGRRVAGIKIAPELIFVLLGLHKAFPAVDLQRGLGADYDFDADVFKLKWECDEFPELAEGEKIPYIEVVIETTPEGPRIASWELP